MTPMQKPVMFPPLVGLLSAVWSGVLGTLIRFRMLPFLKEDTILSGGKQVPTEQFAHFGSNFFYGAAAAIFVLGLIGIATLTEPRRRYIAQLPAWQRWMFWPFHTAPAAVSPDLTSGPSAANGLEEVPLPDLRTALRRYWYHLIGVGVFSSVLRLCNPPIYLVPPFFFGVAFYAAWPCITKRAPMTFWFVAGGVWMGGAILSGFLH